MIPVVWSDKMVPIGAEKLCSQSAMKPNLAVRDWLSRGLSVDVIGCRLARKSMIQMAHDPSFVSGVLNLEIANGFGTFDSQVNDSLKYTVGSFVDAAKIALSRHPVVCSPSSGFHHAGYDECGSFCTFNGLMVAAMELIDDNSSRKVFILDMDHHYGDGTINIIERLGLSKNVSCVTGFDGDPEANIDGIVAMIIGCDADIVFYQAGVDSHIDDRCGGKFTTDQLYRRDLEVFNACKKAEIPVVWNLAGGYQSMDKVLELHANTMKACLEVFG